MRTLPFAGKYVFSGPLSRLNKYRGNIDPLVLAENDPRFIVLDDSYSSTYCLDSDEVSNPRLSKYSIPDYIPSDTSYDWVTYTDHDPPFHIIKKLLHIALQKAHAKSSCDQDCHWHIHLVAQKDLIDCHLSDNLDTNITDHTLSFNVNKMASPQDLSNSPYITAHMFIDPRALMLVLLGIHHWNNYEVANVYFVRRFPDLYLNTMYSYLNFLCI